MHDLTGVVPQIIKDYYGALESAGNSLSHQKDTFIETFAPKPEDDSKIFEFFLTLMPIPLTAAVPRFFGTALKSMKYFSGVTGGDRRAAWEAGTITLVGTASSIAKEALASASNAREEIAFNDIFDRIITAWKVQIDRLLVKVFDGSDSSIDLLTDLVSGGKMIGGMSDRAANDYNENYTKNWQDTKYIERAFHALAIPTAWAANRPTPFILDFKHDSKTNEKDGCVIDATPYFEERANKYNAGWRCIDKRSYILAGVDDTPKKCRQETTMCVPPKNYFKILKGIDELQEPGKDSWGHVTVNDLIIG